MYITEGQSDSCTFNQKREGVVLSTSIIGNQNDVTNNMCQCVISDVNGNDVTIQLNVTITVMKDTIPDDECPPFLYSPTEHVHFCPSYIRSVSKGINITGLYKLVLYNPQQRSFTATLDITGI